MGPGDKPRDDIFGFGGPPPQTILRVFDPPHFGGLSAKASKLGGWAEGVFLCHFPFSIFPWGPG